MYEAQMQFIPGNDQIWVARLNPDDPVYQYPTLMEVGAQAEADRLQKQDTQGVIYKVASIV